MPEYKLNFDGCSKGNPGESGAGAVIYYLDNEIWCETYYIGDKFTNNYAEYMGLIIGLKKALALDIKKITIEGDSLLVINQMKGLYKCNSSNIIELYNTAKDLEKQFDKIEYNHVLRNKNKRADQLSNDALKNKIKK